MPKFSHNFDINDFMRFFNFIIILIFSLSFLFGQTDFEPNQFYHITSIQVAGADYSNPQTLISISGLEEGVRMQVPGIQLPEAIKRLWKTSLFADVKVEIGEKRNDSLTLIIRVKEQPRIGQLNLSGISKSHAEELEKLLRFTKGTLLTAEKKKSAKRIIRNFYVEKGFYNVNSWISNTADPLLPNSIVLNIRIEKGKKIKVGEIQIAGNAQLEDKQIKKQLKPIREKNVLRFWAPSKYIHKDLEIAKKNVIAAYQEEGYRDAIITSDSVYRINEKEMGLQITVDEGNKYYHRNISWAGNTRYHAEILSKLLGIKKGDPYNTQLLEQRLYQDPIGGDISSLYLDDGYLFFQVKPREVSIDGDSIDIELTIFEGTQATIGKVLITGNDRTSENVIRRQIRTTPGEAFSRSEVIRSQRELMALGYFDPEKMDILPIPNQEDGTVDLVYKVEEKLSDRIQLQGGWSPQIKDDDDNVVGGGMTGTIQLNFTNFALKRIFNPESWKPIPVGDGQGLSLSYQTTGKTSQLFGLSFLEPWLGGKKPNSLGFNINYQTLQSFDDDSTKVADDLFRSRIFSASLDFGTQIGWPDDYTRYYSSLAYRYYDLKNPGSFYPLFEEDKSAFIHSLTLKQTLERNSVNHPIFPTAGSVISLSLELTPPYSLFGDEDYEQMTNRDKYKLLEYHKWKFKYSGYNQLAKNFVLNTQIEAGYLGAYNSELGIPPFERFVMGGSGIQTLGGGGFYGLDIVPLRGYKAQSINNDENYFPLYTRFVAEARYLLPFSDSMPAWILGFVEAGNAFTGLKEYKPFDLKRSAGLGVRINVPMLGLIGVDWGYGFDKDPSTGLKSGSQIHINFGQQF